MKTEPTTLDAYNLLHDGAIALADAEEAGIAVDVPYLKKQYGDMGKDIMALKADIDDHEEAKLGKCRYRGEWDPSNNNHVAYALQAAGVTLPQTENENTNAVKTDAETLEAVGGPFIGAVMRLRKLEKIRNTYIAGWLREVDDGGYMHPFFNLHTVKTFRSSSDSPNFQNVPRRDKEAQAILRRAIIPSVGNQIVEVDYGAMEVRILACYTRDPALIKYIEDGNDMHVDVGSWDFQLPTAEVTKDIRDIAKNGGTFPRFYGSWWKSIAANYAKRIKTEDPRTTSGKRLVEHVESFTATWKADLTDRKRKIDAAARNAGEARYRKKHLPSSPLEFLVERGEKIFWDRFNVTRERQDEWVEEYEKTGSFTMLTGHRCSGLLSRNDLFNWRVQGTAFLCLLWAYIEENNWMRGEDLDSRLVGQIHDSMVGDINPRELKRWAKTTKRIMTEDIREAWPWVIVPLLAEFEATPVDAGWNEKEKIEV